MKIKSLSAQGVHGYLPLEIQFFSDLTFLTGVNGSGKTSALRLLVALLTPLPEEIAQIAFSAASVVVEDSANDHVVVSAEKQSDGVELRISTVEDKLSLTSSDLQFLLEFRRREDYRGRDEADSPVFAKIANHPVYVAIRAMATPMFLGLDRRFVTPGWPRDEAEVRRRDFLLRKAMSDDPLWRSAPAIGSVADLNALVVERMQDVRAAQEKLDEDLRRRIFTKAFEYRPGEPFLRYKAPSRAELDGYRAHLDTIERAAEGLKLPAPELQTMLAQFFEKMTKVVDSLEESANKSAKRGKKPRPQQYPMTHDLMEWLVNRPQSDRILEHLQLLDSYVADRASLREPIDRFLLLLNGFLSQTRKRVDVAHSGALQVWLDGNTTARPITALSSGERQVLVMLGHLSLNEHLSGSGVFIVDEPELSLHIGWQERFVESVREANPTVQLIFATHSPAIILDRVDACRSLS